MVEIKIGRNYQPVLELEQVATNLAHSRPALTCQDLVMNHGSRLWYLAMSAGSKLASRSRGISGGNGPLRVSTVFAPLPSQWFPVILVRRTLGDQPDRCRAI